MIGTRAPKGCEFRREAVFDDRSLWVSNIGFKCAIARKE